MNMPDPVAIERTRIHEARQLRRRLGISRNEDRQHVCRNLDVAGERVPLILIERIELLRPHPVRLPSLDRRTQTHGYLHAVMASLEGCAAPSLIHRK